MPEQLWLPVVNLLQYSHGMALPAATSDDKDDDDDVYTLFRSSGIRDTSQAATGLSAKAAEGSAKRSGAMGQSSSDGRPERAQQSKHATLPQTQGQHP